MSLNQTFSLDSETSDILADFKKKTRVNKSELIRMVMKYFSKHKDILEKIIDKNINIDKT